MPDKKDKEIVFDLRVVERNLEKGVISRKEYEKFLADLEDSKGNVAPPEPEE